MRRVLHTPTMFIVVVVLGAFGFVVVKQLLGTSSHVHFESTKKPPRATQSAAGPSVKKSMPPQFSYE